MADTTCDWRAEALADVAQLSAEIGLPPPPFTLPPKLQPSADPVIWRGYVALWMYTKSSSVHTDDEQSSTSSHASAEQSADDSSSEDDIHSVLLLFGPNGVTRTRLLDANVCINATFEHGNQLFAIANTEDLYVWRSLHDMSRCFSYGHWESFGVAGTCDCARANALIFIMTVEQQEDSSEEIYTDDVYVAGVDACECADTSTPRWRYKHLPALPVMPDSSFVLTLEGKLLRGGDSEITASADPYDDLRQIEADWPTFAPAWAPERHRHHHACVRALVLQLLVLARWAPGARLPAALWHRILERTADCSAADLRSFIRDK